MSKPKTFLLPRVALAMALWVPGGVLAQASPFSTGTTAMVPTLLTILTPIAVLVVMVLGVAAWFNRIAWSWFAGGMIGIVLVFGAPQIVAWTRGLFGV